MRIILLVSTLVYALIFTNNMAHSQTPEYEWAKSAIGTGDDRGNAIAVDVEGNLIVTGRYRSPSITFENITLTNKDSGNADVFIVKYSPDGNVLWAQSAGGERDDHGLSCCTDTNGNILLIGGFDCPSISFGKFTLINTSKSADIFIVKYAPDGKVLWAKSAGGVNWEGDYSTCAFDAKGDIIIASSFHSPSIKLDSIVLTNSGTDAYDNFIAKYSSNGDILWAKKAISTKDDMSQSCTIDPVGNIIIGGYFADSIIKFESTTLFNAGGSDVFVVKYDPNGNLLWAKSIGGPEDELALCSSDADGNIIVSGLFFSPSISFGSTTLTNNGVADFCILKFDPNGNPLWAKSAGGTSMDASRGCITAQNGNTLAIGSFCSPIFVIGNDTLTNTHKDSEYMFITEFDAKGEFLWAKGTGGENRNVGRKCAYDGSGNIYATGSFENSTLSFGSLTLTNTGEADMFIVKLAVDRDE